MKRYLKTTFICILSLSMFISISTFAHVALINKVPQITVQAKRHHRRIHHHRYHSRRRARHYRHTRHVIRRARYHKRKHYNYLYKLGYNNALHYDSDDLAGNSTKHDFNSKLKNNRSYKKGWIKGYGDQGESEHDSARRLYEFLANPSDNFDNDNSNNDEDNYEKDDINNQNNDENKDNDTNSPEVTNTNSNIINGVPKAGTGMLPANPEYTGDSSSNVNPDMMPTDADAEQDPESEAYDKLHHPFAYLDETKYMNDTSHDSTVHPIMYKLPSNFWIHDNRRPSHYSQTPPILGGPASPTDVA